jgi:hypothetical protein
VNVLRKHHMAVNELIATKAATTATYGGSAGAVYFGFTANEVAALGGLFIAIIGLCVNVYYKHKHLELARKNQPFEDDE